MNAAYRYKPKRRINDEESIGKKAEILPMIGTQSDGSKKTEIQESLAVSENQTGSIPEKSRGGRRSEVYAFQIDDLKKVLEYFKEHEMWIHRLILIISCNMARRIGDTLDLKWSDLYNPATGEFRSHIEIKEKKTSKRAAVKINAACIEAIEEYIEHMGCDPSKENYSLPVFLQLSGTYKGRKMHDDGYRKALKKAAKEVGIKYNIGTHSARKTFGMLSRMIHPNDYESMQLLQYIYNHSDEKTTTRYIGLTQEKADKYHDDMGSFINTYVLGEEEYKAVSESPVISITSVNLRDIIKTAYEEGIKNAGEQDVNVHLESLNTIYEMLDALKL